MKRIKNWFLLLPVMIHRLTGWLPFQPKPGEVQFANVGEGTYEDGRKSYLVDATGTQAAGSGVRYLLYKISGNALPAGASAADYVTPCTATTDIPFGSSDDAPDLTGIPIEVKLFGVFRGTVRVVTDGTVANGNYVMPAGSAVTVNGVSTNGAVTVFSAGGGNRCIGRAIIPSDSTSAAGDTITIIPMLPLNNPGV